MSTYPVSAGNMMAVPSPELVEEVLGKTVAKHVTTSSFEDNNGEFISERNRIINKLTKTAKRRKMAKASKRQQRKKK